MVKSKEEAGVLACPFALNQRLIFKADSPIQGADPIVSTRTMNCATDACMAWQACGAKGHGYCAMIFGIEPLAEMSSEVGN